MMNINRNDISRTILSVVAIAGILAVAAVAPNAFQALSFLGLGGKQPRHRKYYINDSVQKLVERGLLVKSIQGKIPVVRLSDEGERLLARFRAKETAQGPVKNWDGVWHIIIYDVKEWRRTDRDRFRFELISFGFTRIQQSVWVSPYDHQDLITLIKADYKIGKDILYIKAKYIERDDRLRKHFGLSTIAG